MVTRSLKIDRWSGRLYKVYNILKKYASQLTGPDTGGRPLINDCLKMTVKTLYSDSHTCTYLQKLGMFNQTG